MNKKSSPEIQNIIFRALHEIAPEVDLQSLTPKTHLREELDIDSMDFRRFIIRLHDELKIDIPEADYGKLVTLENFLDYLQGKL